MKSTPSVRSLFNFTLVLLIMLGALTSATAGPRKIPVGKPVYCDTTAGRTVLDNGSYSKLYCRFTAIMDLQTVHGCCTWAGGILTVKNGDVVCRNGTLSSVCSIQNQTDESYKTSDGTVTLNPN